VYIPRANLLDDEEEIRALVAEVGSAQLVTTGADGYPWATLLPLVWREDRVVAHLARANPHADQLGEDTPALLVVTGPEAYVSPSWYAAKAEHGRVVPTWNYSVVQLRGRARVVTDEAWLRREIDHLVERHEAHRDQPWSTADAPERFVAGQLRAVVGVEVLVESVEAKRKWSQNRSVADRRGVVDGLGEEGRPGATTMAAQVASTLEQG
jgi:transcriptional regulator